MNKVELGNRDTSMDRLVRKARKGPLVLTRRGRPVATLMSVADDADMESLSLSMNPKFIALIEKSREQYRAGLGVSIQDARKRLDVPPAKRRGSATRKKK